MNNVTSDASGRVDSHQVNSDNESLFDQKVRQRAKRNASRAKQISEGKYACQVEGCQTGPFGWPEALRRHHFGTHTDVPMKDGRYYCPGCQFEATDKVKMYHHLRECQPPATASPDTASSNFFDFESAEHDFRSSRNQQSAKNSRTRNISLKKYKCDRCDKAPRGPAELKRHKFYHVKVKSTASTTASFLVARPNAVC
jgi:hypothetical protein